MNRFARTSKSNFGENKKITDLHKMVVKLFQQTKNCASGQNSKDNKISKPSTKDYSKASDKSWDNLDKWTVSQENLRQKILDLLELLY